MPRLKVLKSVAHNLGHHYLSLMNDGEHMDIETHIFHIVRDTNEPHIFIDVMKCYIEPEVFRTKVILDSLIRLKSFLKYLVERQGLTMDKVKSATMRIRYEFKNIQISKKSTSGDIPYDCIVEIIAVNGKKFIGKVEEWWRY
ncbi:MAG: hypothetical protein B5M53_02990 [Candidatus Cloacimonas sp. 4484_209]|nr:MAG: hypothetical protein B5M53_02990 [Candidatus Cloacimonas sp. 4484_209]